MFKCIKNFVNKVWMEVKKMNSYEEVKDTSVWNYLEEEVSTEEIVEVLQEEAKPQIIENEDKRVVMLDLNMKIVNVYASIKETIQEHPDYTYSGLYGCIRGRRQSYKGYIFRYMRDLDKTAN